jgi:hypothetical protein
LDDLYRFRHYRAYVAWKMARGYSKYGAEEAYTKEFPPPVG